LAGCHLFRADHVEGGVLGRVVVYRNGVAFYERNATVEDGRLTIRVPRDKVDDFLKSLTVADRATKKPLSVTIPRKEAVDGSYLTMSIEIPGVSHAEVQLTYVTDAPAWKPSYRVVIGEKGKVMLEGWAIVDNTTSEDWKGVLVGVGASSALAFRYDLWSVHTVDRDLLQEQERFAIAPPTGMSPYADTAGAEELASLDASEVRGNTTSPDAHGKSISGSSSGENAYIVDGTNTSEPIFDNTGGTVTTGTIAGTLVDAKTGEKVVGATVVVTSPVLQGEQVVISDDTGAYKIPYLPPGEYVETIYYDNSTMSRSGIHVQVGKQISLAMKLKSGASAVAKGEVIEISGSVPVIDQGSTKTGITLETNYYRNIPSSSRSFHSVLGAAAGSQSDSASAPEVTKPDPNAPVRQGDEKLKAAVTKVLNAKRDVLIEAHAGNEADAKTRAESVRDKLVDDGVPAARIHVIAKGDGPGQIRVLAVAPGQTKPSTGAPPRAAPRGPISDAPVGESHFIADR
ncbi:MAG TPA: carboxypeptidase regulatory-like domain-containing protein, partial [Kofleriaceae bacterium]|nr:carboxypeptidase regulatory-like domain-containing protein [Kofleriaceae bacterium]